MNQVKVKSADEVLLEMRAERMLECGKLLTGYKTMIQHQEDFTVVEFEKIESEIDAAQRWVFVWDEILYNHSCSF